MDVKEDSITYHADESSLSGRDVQKQSRGRLHVAWNLLTDLASTSYDFICGLLMLHQP